MHSGYSKKEADIKEELADMKRTLETTSISASIEAKLVKDIAKLNNTLPLAAELETIFPLLKAHGAAKKEIFDKLKEVDVKIKAQEAEIDKVKAELKEKYTDQDEQRAVADQITEKIEEKNEKITECYKSKDSIKDEYWSLRF